MYLKKLITFFLIISLFMLPVPANAVSLDPIGFGLWLINLFNSQPKVIVKSKPTYQVVLKLPEKMKEETGIETESLTIPPRNEPGIHRFIKGAKTSLIFDAPTQGKSVRRWYLRINGIEVENEKLQIQGNRMTFEVPMSTNEDPSGFQFFEGGIDISRLENDSVSGHFQWVDLDEFKEQFRTEQNIFSKRKTNAPESTKPDPSRFILRVMKAVKSQEPAEAYVVVINNGKELFPGGNISGEKEFQITPGKILVKVQGAANWLALPGPEIDTRAGVNEIKIFPKGGERR